MNNRVGAKWRVDLLPAEEVAFQLSPEDEEMSGRTEKAMQAEGSGCMDRRDDTEERPLGSPLAGPHLWAGGAQGLCRGKGVLGWLKHEEIMRVGAGWVVVCPVGQSEEPGVAGGSCISFMGPQSRSVSLPGALPLSTQHTN